MMGCTPRRRVSQREERLCTKVGLKRLEDQAMNQAIWRTRLRFAWAKAHLVERSRELVASNILWPGDFESGSVVLSPIKPRMRGPIRVHPSYVINPWVYRYRGRIYLGMTPYRQGAKSHGNHAYMGR
ncbi:hypothetical protein VNO77_03454 [Canavalia gladiata]|uniref:Uncharacterized protein n=1 Tax=Canavalia gladiata TaxID=3824 RepID=A0AAN9R6U9_CANGL